MIFQFAVPFVLLLSRPFKRDVRRLVWLATWIMLMRYLDLFWIIEPNFSTNIYFDRGGYRSSDCHRRHLAGVLFPQSEFAATSARI